MTAVVLALLLSFPVRVAILGDRTGRPDDAEFQLAVEAIVQMSPDIVLSVGDFVEGNGDVATAARDWEHILPTLEKLTEAFPFIYTPGNNDIWNGETAAYWEEYTGTPPSRVEEVMGIAFVVWDSSIPNELTAEHLVEIDELTSGMSGDSPWIFVTHKPFWFMSYQDSAAVRRFRELMEERGPLAVVGGHVHRFAAGRENGILYISAGPSGSAVPDPDPERGEFTQLGWLTVWPDSAACAVIDARGVYPETLNTGREMDLAFRYGQELLRPRPLEQELESAVLRLVPVESVPRDILLEIEPGSWGLRPQRTVVEELDGPREIVFTQNPSGSPYPSPVISVTVSYGERDRELNFTRSWQVLRRANAFRSSARLDGMPAEGEYRLPLHTHFAGPSGRLAEIPDTHFRAATDGERLFIFMEMVDCGDEFDDMAGFVLAGPDDSFLWLKVQHDGSTDWKTLTGRGELLPLESGADAEVMTAENGWCVELAVDLSMLELTDNHCGLHLYRSAGNDLGTWVYPLAFDISTMGRVWLQP